jgi:hypothetical protein
MLSQFDPEIANLFRGEITAVEVNDPAILGHVPNLVLNPNRPFEVRVDWTLTGSEVPVYLKALEDSDWIVTVYAESMGPGPEVKLGEGTEPNGFTVSTSPTPAFSWSHTLSVPAGLLVEEDPGVPGASGVYLLTATVFLNSDIGSPGFDVVGFRQGPMIKVEDPQ